VNPKVVYLTIFVLVQEIIPNSRVSPDMLFHYMLMKRQKWELKDHLFLDIETVPRTKYWEDLPVPLMGLWYKKASMIKSISRDQLDEETVSGFYKERAGIYSEFAKIVCISVGYFTFHEELPEFRIKSFYNHNEFRLLSQFASLMESYFYNPNRHFLVGHNIKEFDVPFLARRLLINKIKLPKLLAISEKKPWQILHIKDTMNMWKFGDYKHYTSLELLATIFDIPTPKDDIDGSEVGYTYWEQNDLARIVHYCEKDVITVAKVFIAIIQLNLEIIPEFRISTFTFFEEE